MISRWFVDTVTVETFRGSGAMGDLFAAPVVLAPPNGCWVENSRKLVRAANGEQLISETTVYTAAANNALFTTDSRVTINGVAARVLKANENDTGGLMPSVDHVAINLI
jgi:hypothetical protein